MIIPSLLLFVGLGGVSAFQCSSRISAMQPVAKIVKAPRFSVVTQMSASSTPSNDFFKSLTGFFAKKEDKVPQKPKIPDAVVDADFSLSYLFVAIGLVIALTNPGMCTFYIHV